MYLYKNHDETVNFCKHFDDKENSKLFLGDCKTLWKIFDWEKETRGSRSSVCEGWRMAASFGCIQVLQQLEAGLLYGCKIKVQ